MILGWMASSAQEIIDYRPKSLVKELKKFDVQELSELEELKIPDSIAKKNQFNGKFFLIREDDHGRGVKYLYMGRVNSCRAGGCSIAGGPLADLDQEYFDYFIMYDAGVRVKLVRVYDYQATHGQEVTVRGWLKQFSGYDGRANLQVGKEIDAISGATISVYAITSDVLMKTRMLKEITATPETQP